MNPKTLTHNDLSCEISYSKDEDHYIGIFRYKVFENGQIVGPSEKSVQEQFGSICRLVDNSGAMVRRGIIMLGYHNRVFKGDVLLLDGELIGSWNSDELEWCHFTEIGKTESSFSAPSPWMLHDVIADHYQPCFRR